MENKELIVILDNAGCKEDYPDFKDKSKTHSPRTKALAAINQHIYKEVMELLPEKETPMIKKHETDDHYMIDKFNEYTNGRNQLIDELRVAAKKRFLQE